MCSIITIHEIGHLLAASYYNYNIHKIHVYPFGGYLEFDDKLNRPLKEEFVVLISGPLIQIIYFLILSFLYSINFINDNTYNIVVNYHYSLLIFNLLPIYPLDGSKLCNIAFSKFLSFKQSHLFMIYTSYIVLLIILLCTRYISFSINLYLLLILLLTKLISESKNHKAIYNRFLLERYLYNFHFPKWKIIQGNKLSKMMKDKFHLFVVDNKEITEKEMLKRKYKQK